METPGVSVPIPIPVPNNTQNSMLNNNEMKCSYSTFDPSNSPPQQSLFLKKLIKRIGSFDTITTAIHTEEQLCDLKTYSCNELKK